MQDIKALTYNEIDSVLLEKALKTDGMVFVRLSTKQAKAFINLSERSKVIEKYKWNRPNWFIRLVHLITAFTALIKAFLFHIRLMELVAFETTASVRCTWEIQENNDYVFIFS